MPRRRRFSSGGYVVHVLNRATARRKIFADDDDFAAFERVLQAAGKRVPIRLLAYCIMPNHWHLVLWPKTDDDLSLYMQWLTVTHTQRWHLAHSSSGTGPLYQGRFKAFPVEEDDHFYQLCRYVERNALRASLVTRAEMWRWSSLWQVTQEHCDVELHAWPLPRPSDWLDYVNGVETEAELIAIRDCAQFGRPYGSAQWKRSLAVQ
ncbi:MAG TPA: transposase [Lacipirellulaceae bacterium]|jgi:putative transposase|nr:transposase [Lacipirellulaceae bacterium]